MALFMMLPVEVGGESYAHCEDEETKVLTVGRIHPRSHSYFVLGKMVPGLVSFWVVVWDSF